MDLVWRSRQQVLKLEGLCSRIPLQLPDGKEDAVSTLNNKITSILSSIVTRYRLYKLNFCVQMQNFLVLTKGNPAFCGPCLVKFVK